MSLVSLAALNYFNLAWRARSFSAFGSGLAPLPEASELSNPALTLPVVRWYVMYRSTTLSVKHSRMSGGVDAAIAHGQYHFPWQPRV